jgi:hypothetical protein
MGSGIINQHIFESSSRRFLIISVLCKRLEALGIKYISDSGSDITFCCNACKKESTATITVLRHRFKHHLQICSKCNPSISFPEKTILKFVSEITNTEIIPNDRKQLGDMELDIYLPKHNLAFEFNGLYWHSEAFKPKCYHKLKTEYADKRGIHLIHIWEDDWRDKTETVKSYIRNLLLENKNRVYAKECVLSKISKSDAEEFFRRNSLGNDLKADVCYGLFKGELISIMCFRKISEGVYNLVYFCNDLNTGVVGGYKKMFAEFVKEYSPEKIYSNASRDWFKKNDLDYKLLGFKFTKYIKEKSIKKIGLNKVWNSGCLHFEWSK